jgi:predicted permease
MLGGALGTVLAVWAAGGANLALSQLPFPLEFDLTLDRRVLAYGFALSVLTALIFGLTPARRAARLDLVPSLKLDGGSAPARQRLRKALVVAQAGVCTILLVWSGLFVRSLGQVNQVDPGFDASNVLLAEIDLPENTPDGAQTRGLLMKDLTDRLSVMPLVESTGFAWTVPLTLNSRMEYPVFLSTEPSGSAGTRVMGNRVTPGWFQTVRIPLEAGRDFTSQDRPGSPPVVIVNRTLADRLFDGNAVGRTLKLYGPNDALVTVEIVGVVADSKYWTLGETIAPAVYQAMYQHADGGTLHVRTTAPATVMNAVRERVRVMAPGAAPTFRSMSDATAVALMPARVGAMVTAAFGLLATLLSVLGVYGLVAFLVVQRTREIGIRKAIGAGTWQIVRLLVGGSLALVLTGLVLGLVGGASSAQVLGGLLVNVSSSDPITLFTVALLVLGSAVAASAVPAARAARIDALITLKAE